MFMDKQILSQRSIDYVPHSRGKQFYLVLPQFRSAVVPDPWARRLTVKKDRFSLLQKQLMALTIIFACLFLLAFEVGWIDYLGFLFR